jgi:hypothetical protein
MTLSRRTFVAGLLTAPVLAACGGGDDSDAAPTTTAAPTTSAPTTAPPPPPPTAPLTGQAFAGDPALLARPALVVKIDNADGGRETARPQAGLNQADIVFEERVEGSVTRLAAVFHSADSDPVGPVRSFRTTDLEVVANLNHPLFAWSGANAIFAQQARSGPLIDVGYDAASGAYHRDGSRRAPHNLMSSTPALFALAPAGATAPLPLFTYRPDGTPPAGGRPVGVVQVTYGGGAGSAPVEYHWDAPTGTFLRVQKGTPHLDAFGQQVNPANVIVQFVDYVDTGAVDVSGTAVPRAALVGTGSAWGLTAGTLTEATWNRASADSATIYTDAAGAPISLTPGRTWVALPQPGGGTVLA